MSALEKAVLKIDGRLRVLTCRLPEKLPGAQARDSLRPIAAVDVEFLYVKYAAIADLEQ